MPDIDERVLKLERDFERFRGEIKEAIGNIREDIKELSTLVKEMVDEQHDLDKVVERKFVKYNNYSERFVTKLEHNNDIMLLKNKLDNIEREQSYSDKLQDKILRYWSIVLTIILIVYYFVYMVGGG